MNDKTTSEPVHDNLRDLIGQAISDEIAAGAEQPDWCDSREIDRLAEAVLAVLPTAEASAPVAASGDPFMYAIMTPGGSAHMGEHCVDDAAEGLYEELNGLNDSPDTGYTIVPLYLAAPQQHAEATDPVGQHNAEAAQQKLVEHVQAALSGDDIVKIGYQVGIIGPVNDGNAVKFARAIIAAMAAQHGEKGSAS